MSKEKKDQSKTLSRNLDPVQVTLIYTEEDKAIAEVLKQSMMPLEKLQRIHLHDLSNLILKDQPQETELELLKNSSLVLLLISPDFINKDFCYGDQACLLAENTRSKQQQIIPIIVRPTPFWKELSFGKNDELPKDDLAISEYAITDRAIFDVAKGIKKHVNKIINIKHDEVSL